MGHSSPFRVQGICPPDPTRYSFGYLTCGRRLFGAKNCLHAFFICLIMIYVCAGYNSYFSRYAFLLNSDDFSVMAFSCSCIYAYFLSSFTAYFFIYSSVIFPWKSGNIALFFRHVSFNIQWILLVNIFSWAVFLSCPFIHLPIRLFIRCFFALSFELFSFLIYYLFRVLCFC